MENNYTIFKELKPFENTKLSNFRGYDLSDLIQLIKGYNLEYRNKLNFRNKASIGCEIEFEDPQNKKLVPIKDDDIEIKPGWLLREDATLSTGGEIVSPIFFNNEMSWTHFKSVLDLLDGNASITENCGAHVHIGTQLMGNKPTSWNNFLLLWSSYENIIYRFAFGEYLNARILMYQYAKPLVKDIDKYFEKIKKRYGNYFDMVMPLQECLFNSLIRDSRNGAINFRNVHSCTKFNKYNTIEFRLANGTINPIIWQNLINFYISLILYAKSELFDKDIVLKRKNDKIVQYLNPVDYTEIFYEQALELADLLFNKNIDKVYFLRQYIKDGEKTYHHGLVKSQKFTV